VRKSRSEKVQEVARRPYWYREDASLVVAAWRASGTNLTEFAASLGIDRRRLARWAARLGVEQERRRPPRRTGRAMRFHPVRVVPEVVAASESADTGTVIVDRAFGGSAIEIELGGVGHKVRIEPGFASLDLERVVAVLMSAAISGRET
jgi:hypothetical protein